MSEETAIYEKDGIKITNLRAVFNEKTYSVSNITSVETKTIPPSSGGLILLAAIAIPAILCGLSDFEEYGSYLFVGVVCIALLFVVNKSQKTNYAVSLTTASGEVKAYTSPDKESIQTIVTALNDAIIQKG